MVYFKTSNLKKNEDCPQLIEKEEDSLSKNMNVNNTNNQNIPLINENNENNESNNKFINLTKKKTKKSTKSNNSEEYEDEESPFPRFATKEKKKKHFGILFLICLSFLGVFLIFRNKTVKNNDL